MGFDQSFIELVRTSTDIVGLVSQYVPLKPAGKSFKGLCPFHNEKTPSFHVNPERQIFHCFGCHEGGDAFKFVMLYEKLSFVEAVEQLASRAGLRVPRRSHDKPGAEEERGSLMRLHDEAARFFQNRLMESDSTEAERARAYLKTRGFSEETVREHGLGLAPDAWTSLLEHLTRRGAPPQLVEKAGLAVRRKSGSGGYDRFRNRLMIPIRSESGRVIAFGGRILGDGEPKYLNSSESPIYNKSRVLYGFHRAKEFIRKEGLAVLMEGYMDCLQAYQGGVGEAVACCGTSLTASHARLLRRYTERVIVSFDPDPAGRRAARRSIDLLLEEGFEVRVLVLPGGEDPDTYVRNHGGEAYRSLLRQAPPFVEFLIQEASERYDVDTPRGKASLLNDILPVIAKVPNRVERVGYVGPLAETAGISDRAILEELRRHVEKKAPRFQLPSSDGPAIKLAERELIRWILTSPESLVILDEIEEEDLDGLVTAPILRAMKQEGATGELTMERLLDRLGSDDALRSQLTRIATEPSPLGPRQSARDCLDRLRQHRYEREQSRLRAQKGQEANDDDLAHIHSLARRIHGLR